MKKILDEFTGIGLTNKQRRYLRAKRDNICIRCFNQMAESDRSWCSICRGLKEKINTYPRKNSVSELKEKALKKNKGKLILKWIKPRKQNQHHRHKYKSGWKSLKEICLIEKINYPMGKYYYRKYRSIKKTIKKLLTPEKGRV